MPQSTPAWKHYEHDVAHYLRSIDPNAELTHDAKVIGASNVERQVDVLGKVHILGNLTSIAVECKAFGNRRAGIEHVDEFIGKLLDLRAPIGLLISQTGFTSHARLRATSSCGGPQIRLETLRFVGTPEATSDLVAELTDARYIEPLQRSLQLSDRVLSRDFDLEL